MNRTIAKVGYAPLTEEDGQYTYKDIIWFKSTEAGGREISAEPEGESTTIYADGLPVVIADENAGYKIKVQLLSIIDDIETNWLGNKKSETGDIYEVGDAVELPRFALVTAKEQFKATKKYEIDTYYNCIVSKRPSRSDKTSEGKFDPQFPEFEITASPRIDNKVVRHTQYCDDLPTKTTEPEAEVLKTISNYMRTAVTPVAAVKATKSTKEA